MLLEDFSVIIDRKRRVRQSHQRYKRVHPAPLLPSCTAMHKQGACCERCARKAPVMQSVARAAQTTQQSYSCRLSEASPFCWGTSAPLNWCNGCP